jgi:lysophospholipid acyltransferase (LPLAT)-like uncharacterized protein
VKRLLRLGWLQSTLAFLLSAYMDAATATMRWRYEGREVADAAFAAPDGAIACFWHGKIALAVGIRRILKQKPRRVLISLSRDGEFIAKAVERLGFPAIRGSATRKGSASAKGGAAAFRQALRFMGDGGVIVVTPDGPRGPAEVMPDGPVTLARAGQAPVLMFGMAARPAVIMNSWDKARLPLPFSRGWVVIDGPFFAPADADEAAREALRTDWQARLRAAQARAEALVAGTAA